MSSIESKTKKVRTTPVLTVQVGIYLLGLLLLLGFILGPLMAAASLETSIKDPSTEGLKPLAWMFVLGGMVILAAPTVFCLYMTYRRRVWALILLIALTGLDIAFYLHAVLNEGVGSSLSSYAALAANAVKLIAVILLVAPPSLAWFKGRDSTPRLG